MTLLALTLTCEIHLSQRDSSPTPHSITPTLARDWLSLVYVPAHYGDILLLYILFIYLFALVVYI